MVFQVFFLALATAIRPTSMAAVYALLSAPVPRRLMFVYVFASLFFTLAVGALILVLFPGTNADSGQDTPAIVDLIAGGIILTFGVGVATGRLGGKHGEDVPGGKGRWASIKEREPSLKLAAIAGPATHFPGIFYLLALNVIAADDASLAASAILVAIYCLIWCAVPIMALITCIVRPEAAREWVGEIDRWGRRHGRTIAICACVLVGALLIIRALVGLH